MKEFEYATDGERRGVIEEFRARQVDLKGGLHQHKSKKRNRREVDDAPWADGGIRDDRGRIVPNLANAMVALRAAPELIDAFAFDEMLRAPLLTKELPVAPGAAAAGGSFPRLLLDTDVSQAQEWLQHRGMPKIGREQMHQAIERRAAERSFHPVTNYLDRLAWDGEQRLEHWLADYLGAEQNDYVAHVGRMFLIAMVARVYRPGCKADYMLVLEGEQGTRKSGACRILAGDWFSDSLPEIHQKDAAQHLRGKWLIEVAELSATKRADLEGLKAFISKTVERYRPSYGRGEVIEPRQCVFIGTTNGARYLKDETGGRRFWPVRVGEIDLAAVERDRDQILAEAASRYRAGEHWWPDHALERELIRPEQEARYETDAWEEAICAYLTPPEGAARTAVKVTEVAMNVFGLELGKIGTTEQRRVSRVLQNLGWVHGEGALRRHYVPRRDS